MARTVLEIIRTAGTSQEVAYALLTLSHRPEIIQHGAIVRDAGGSPLDTLVLVENDDNGGDGARRYSIRCASPDDALSMASAGDIL